MVSFDSTQLRIANRGILSTWLMLSLPALQYLRFRFGVYPAYFRFMDLRLVNLPAGACLASLVEILREPLVDDLPVDTPEQLPVESSFCTGHYKIHISAVQCPEVIQYHSGRFVYLS